MKVVLIIVLCAGLVGWLIKMICEYRNLLITINNIESDIADIKTIVRRIEENSDETVNVGRENRMHLEDIIKDANRKKNL